MGAMNYARFADGRTTQYPNFTDYERCIAYLKFELAAAEAEQPGIITRKVIALRTQLDAYRSTLRRIRWRMHLR